MLLLVPWRPPRCRRLIPHRVAPPRLGWTALPGLAGIMRSSWRGELREEIQTRDVVLIVYFVRDACKYMLYFCIIAALVYLYRVMLLLCCMPRAGDSI